MDWKTSKARVDKFVAALAITAQSEGKAQWDLAGVSLAEMQRYHWIR